MIETINYEFKRGDTHLLKKFRPRDSNKQVIMLSDNDNIYFTMKKDANGEAILKKRVNNGITYESDGFYHITMEPHETANLSSGTYQYDIELNLSSWNPKYVKTIIEGEIELLQDITGEGDKI